MIRVEWVEEVPLHIRKTKKKYWDSNDRVWKDTNVYRILQDRTTENWLTENFGPSKPGIVGLEGSWQRIGSWIVMSEDIYLFYCLKFSNI